MTSIRLKHSTGKYIAGPKNILMKGIVIFKSKYGATRQYAQWIGNELSLPVFETWELDTRQIENYDFVIVGSSVYIGKMLIKKWLKNNRKVLMNKKIFLFVVSGTPVSKKDKLDSYVNASVPAEVRNMCDIYFLPGKMIIKELSWIDRLMIKMGARLAKEEEVKKGMLRGYNDVKKENIGKLINAVKTILIVKSEALDPDPAG